MDYEKKYNEALNWMRELYPGLHGATKEDAEQVFPELRESEDERVRKTLIHIVKGACDKYGIKYKGDDITEEKLLSYLEKQKEQKPETKYVYPKFRKGDVIEPVTPNGSFTPVRVVGIYDGSYSCRSDDNKAYLSLPIKQEDEYKLVEQKPAEKQDYSGLTDLERAIHRGFLVAGVKNVPVTIIKETARECLEQMNPAEWDDYTTTNLDRALQIIKDAKGTLQGYQSDDGIYECDKAIRQELIKQLKEK